MAAMMKAAVVRELGQPLVIDEVAVPEPGPGQILVRIAATGVCHTDLHAVRGDWPVKPQPPFIPGHEGVGIVAALGSGVKRVKEGDRVGVPWLHTACGYCQHCRTGWETLCGAQQNTGYSVNGSFGEYALADPNFVGRLPEKLDWGPAAPVLCAGVTRLQGPQGDRGEARRMGCHLGHRRSRPHGGAVRPRHGDACGGGRCSCRQADAGHEAGCRHRHQRARGGPGGRVAEARSAARTASWSPRYRRPRSSRPSACCARTGPCRWWGCRPVSSPCRSSRPFSSA